MNGMEAAKEILKLVPEQKSIPVDLFFKEYPNLLKINMCEVFKISSGRYEYQTHHQILT